MQAHVSSELFSQGLMMSTYFDDSCTFQFDMLSTVVEYDVHMNSDGIIKVVPNSVKCNTLTPLIPVFFAMLHSKPGTSVQSLTNQQMSFGTLRPVP